MGSPLAVDKSKPLEKGSGAELRSKSRLTCGGLVMTNELDSRVAVVHTSGAFQKKAILF